MNKEKLREVINGSKSEVFVFSTPCPIHVSFATHVFFVINENDKISRYEVLFFKNKHDNGNHLYVDFFKPCVGLNIIPFCNKFFWTPKLLVSVKGMSAIKLIKIIKESINNYPYKYCYNILGPNSNSYAQWVLSQVPELKIKLPINAIGKNYWKNQHIYK